MLKVGDYYFDTSGLAKRHLGETGSAWVRSLIRAKAGHRVYIACITAVEMYAAITRRQHAAITRRQHAGDLSAAQAGAILGHFRRHLIHRYRVIELSPALFADAKQTARTHRLRAYDAVQLAVALQVKRLHQNAGLGPITFVSADRGLNTAAAAEGFSVENPNDHS